MVAVFSDVSEHCHSEFLSPAVSGLVSAEQGSGKLVCQETEPEVDRHSQAKTTDWPTGHNIHHQNLPEQSTDLSVEATSDTKPSANGSLKGLSHAVSPKPRQRLLGLFRREKDKTAEVQSPQKEEMKEPGNTQNLSQCAADTTVEKPASVKEKVQPSEMTGVRTLQLTALQNTPFKEAETQQEATEDRAVHLLEKLSNLKAFWERENSSPKIIFTGEEARHKDIAKTRIEASNGPQTNSGVESTNNNLSPQMEITIEDTAGTSQDKCLLPQTDCNLYVDLPEEDGTYRANPVLIYEETDDSLTGSVSEAQISEPQENFLTTASSVTFNTQKQEGKIPVSLPSNQEDKPAKISELKHFWEKEYTEPKVIAAKIKEAARSSILGNTVVSPSLDSREESGREAKTSPYKTRSNVVLKSLKASNRSPDRSQLRSSASTGDVQSTCHQYPVRADTGAQERPLSPSKSQPPRSKDQDDEVRRSPSKTCHPRVLPRESSNSKRSRLEGSPLKTFPIDIDPKTEVTEEHQGRPTPVPRQRKIPSHEAMQTVLTDTKPSAVITSYPLPVHPEDTGIYFSNANTQQSSSSFSTSPQSKTASEKKLGTFTRLARSFIPQDYQHYLGPQEKAHVPPFHQEKAASSESVAVNRPQNALKDTVGNQSDSPSSWIVQDKDGNSSQGSATRARSRASSGSELLNSLSTYFSSS